jgi:hypothetical protein
MPLKCLIKQDVANAYVRLTESSQSFSEIQQVHFGSALNQAYGADDDEAVVFGDLARLFFVEEHRGTQFEGQSNRVSLPHV